MRLCSYIVKTDAGLAPNPFWGYCTLALCTPNHQGVKLNPDDWIVGFLDKKRQYKLLYAMKIKEVLDFSDYYKSNEYQKKIPNVNGDWRQRCGDNMYYKDSSGDWVQHPSIYHKSEVNFRKDAKYHRVYISEHFYYFGKNSQFLPESFQVLLKRSQGVKCNHDPKIVCAFLKWLQVNYRPGIGKGVKPNDNPDLIKRTSTSCST